MGGGGNLTEPVVPHGKERNRGGTPRNSGQEGLPAGRRATTVIR